MDQSQIYDLDDEPSESRPARYALILANNRAVFSESENTIALLQRAWRVLNGFHPMTGEPGFAEDYVIEAS